MNTQTMPLAYNIQGALTMFGLDMLDSFMSEPAELAGLTPAAPLIPASAAYLEALAAYVPPRRLPEPNEPEPGDEWDF